MLNQLVIVGRLKNIIKEDKMVIIKLSVPRCYKNDKNKYDSDIITCSLNNSFASCCTETLKLNELIGVKGRLESNENDEMIVRSEKITFLTNNLNQE